MGVQIVGDIQFGQGDGLRLVTILRLTVLLPSFHLALQLHLPLTNKVRVVGRVRLRLALVAFVALKDLQDAVAVILT